MKGKNQSFFFLSANADAPARTRNAVGTAIPFTPVFGLFVLEFELELDELLFLLDVVVVFAVVDVVVVVDDTVVVVSSSFLISNEYGSV